MLVMWVLKGGTLIELDNINRGLEWMIVGRRDTYDREIGTWYHSQIVETMAVSGLI